jgi:hypothetical protein
MKMVLSGNRVFNEIIKLRINGKRIEFWYYPDNVSEPLKMVTSKEALKKLEYEFKLDE